MSEGGLAHTPPADGQAALAATLAWLRAVDAPDDLFSAPKPLDVSGAENSLAEQLAAAGLPDWREAILAANGPGGPMHLEPRLEWLMAHAALEAAVAADLASLFGAVEALRMLGDVSEAGLASAVVRRLAPASDAHPLLDRLHARLETLWASRFNARLRAYVEAMGDRVLTARDLWPQRDGMPLGDGWAHRVGAALWPARYMALLAKFPAPFQHGFGDPLAPISAGQVAALVRASPAVFSAEGAPLGPVVVFVLLEAVEAHLAVLAVRDNPAAEAGLLSLLDALFARADGDWISRAWLQQILWRDVPRRAGRSEAEVEAQRALREALIVFLSQQISPLGASAIDWVRQEQPLWAVHRLLAEASICQAHGDAVGAAGILAAAVREGLVSATGRPGGLVTQSPEATVVGRVLAHHPDMQAWFETLWRDTYELREQLSYPAHQSLDNPAYPAISWGLIGLNGSLEAPVDSAGLWRAIAQAVFETQRIDPHASLFNGAMPPITLVTVQIGAAMTQLGVVAVDDLAAFMAGQLDPSAEHARLWHIIRSAVSDAVALAVGRAVGAQLLRQALEAALGVDQPSWDPALDTAARADLASFAERLELEAETEG